METPVLLEKYRNDRRKLLEFLLSSDLIKQAQHSYDSNISVDSISVDHVLNCINSGEVLDLAEAATRYSDAARFPATIETPLGSHYFLCCDPNLSGSPPRRVPPKPEVEVASSSSEYTSNPLDPLVTEDTWSDDCCGCTDKGGPCEHHGLVEDADVLSFGLPVMTTGLSDDDLRESAYEVLLGSMACSGFQLYYFENKKKENKSRFLSRIKSKKEKIDSKPQMYERHLLLLNIIRSQMQIAEAMDTCIRQRLMQCASITTCKQVDVPQISLELLNSIGKYDFSNERLYTKWKKRQVDILEELLRCTPSHMADEQIRIKSSIAILRNNGECSTRTSTSEQAKVLGSIKKFVLKLSSLPQKFCMPNETYYWTSAYHLNINLYEKLLYSAFDILEEGQILKEVDDIFDLIKVSWDTLGINQRMHDGLYGWVLFRKFVETGEIELLNNAIRAVKEVQSRDDDDRKQVAYMNSLVCSGGINGRPESLNLLDAIFLSISFWCDKKLKDYHRHFSQKAINFEKVLTLYMLVGVHSVEETGEIKLMKYNARPDVVNRHLKACIEYSIQATCRRLSHIMNTNMIKPNSEGKYPMAMLADEMIMVAEKESTLFSPVLCRWCPEAGTISSMQLHKFYGKKLKSFLGGVTSLSDEVRLVLPAAYMLDQKLTHLFHFARGEENLHSAFHKGLNHYQIGEVCRPIILDWVNGQHAHILEWTQRALDLEDWESLSFRQRYAASIIEVFRILEETVDQLFGLKLPLDTMHLQSILSIIFSSLETYLLKMATQLVEKNHLLPASPALTRYKETVIPTIKKKSISCTILEENILDKLKSLTLSKLCVRINTLQYIQNKLGDLEDGIRECWALVSPCVDKRWATEKILGNGSSTCSESVDELFTTFNKISKDAGEAINTICDTIGTRAVFWDLRDSFLFSLYRGKGENARMESSIPHFDSVLDQVCTIITDPLRDRVVLSICRASMDGYIWVLLEGGPSRAFVETDAQLMQEDLQILKDFFVADGEGLAAAVVDEEAILAENTIYLYSLQTETLIEMLMMASEQVFTTPDPRNPGGLSMEHAHTLLRVLCHKKDPEASRFLKMHYQLPKSSEYEDTSTESSPYISDLLNRSKSSHWAKKSQKSFKSMTKKFQEATSEIRLGGI